MVLPYAARQLIWMLQSAVQLVLAMSKGVMWVIQMIRLFIYVAMVWIFFLSTVMWYMTSSNIIRLVAYRSSETTRRRNVLRVLEEEGVDLGPLLVREQRRGTDRAFGGRRSLKDTHMGPGPHVSVASHTHSASSAVVMSYSAPIPRDTARASVASADAVAAVVRPGAAAAAARRHWLATRNQGRGTSELGTHDDEDSLGPSASAPQLRPSRRVGQKGGSRMYTDLVTVERLLNLNPADGSALKSLPYSRKAHTGPGAESANSGPGPMRSRRPPPPPRHRRPFSAENSLMAEHTGVASALAETSRSHPTRPDRDVMEMQHTDNNNNTNTSSATSRRRRRVGSRAGRGPHGSPAGDSDVDISGLPLPLSLHTPHADDDEEEARGHTEHNKGPALEDVSGRHVGVHYYADMDDAQVLNASSADDVNGHSTPVTAESAAEGAAIHAGLSPDTTAAVLSALRATPKLHKAAGEGEGEEEEEEEAVRASAAQRPSPHLSPSPSRPYPPRRAPLGPAPARRHRPSPPPVVSGVGAASQCNAYSAEPVDMDRHSTQNSSFVRQARRDDATATPHRPRPHGAAPATLASPKRLSADLEEEDEEDRMNLHNRSTVDIILPVPMDSLMKTLDFANRNGKLRRKKFPIIILITGGVWIIGSHMWGMLVARVLAQRGYVVFCPDYRNFPQTTMEGMVLDVSDAIAWVLNNAERYNGDLEDVTLLGHSCGAHLSMMSLLSQAHLAAVRQAAPHSGQLPAPSEVAYNVPRYYPRRAIHRFVGLSGMYDIEGLETHFSSKGLNSPVLARIAGGRENLARYSLHAYFDPYRRGTTGEFLPDTIFDFFPARLFYLHGEKDKVTPPSQSASLVGVMRQAQKDSALKRLTWQDQYRRHVQGMLQQQQQQQQQQQTGGAGQGSAEHALDGEALEPGLAPLWRTTSGHAEDTSGSLFPDPLPPSPAGMEYVLILGAGHTDAVVEECLVGGRSCCVDFLCDYEAASVPWTATHEGQPLDGTHSVSPTWQAAHPAAGTVPATSASCEGLTGGVMSGATQQHGLVPFAERSSGRESRVMNPTEPGATGMPDGTINSPAWSDSRLSVSQCTPGGGAGGVSAMAGSTAARHRPFTYNGSSNASLSALSAATATMVSERQHGASSTRRTRSPAVPHEVPPDAWLPMSVPREQWPLALRIASMISPF